ncbi:MAG: hypothetical protein Q8K75_10070 [Chlamydiales bacterium]|nr:hypothetical protein [Chlamydiales bacterium]
METYATSIYVISDEVLRLLDFRDDPQSRMSSDISVQPITR